MGGFKRKGDEMQGVNNMEDEVRSVELQKSEKTGKAKRTMTG